MTATHPDAAQAKPRRTRQTPSVRRQDLLAVTVSCLARLGPRGATGRAICREAGVSHGLLRHYFRNPDNLLLETYEQLCEQLLVWMTDAVAASGDDPWAQLRGLFEAVFAAEWSSADLIAAWMAFWQLARSREDFAEVSESFNLRQRALLQSVVGRLPQGPATPPLADAVAVISAVMDGLWIELFLSQARTPADRCVALCEATARRLFAG
ncbi:TetR/AcrR family transcriptional regulator [Novosphingobium sp. FKTRR1]|uniref:TetR/AcrR family transcriptional regulator n=1 Tax=Novosphingobium sp. FKTRR1 TaxID=2879118 RepID=UPI001CF09C12|nr:TetR family transcriptional regulator C-terminal domain-containing protein [Novosphingobium sp. FKTRR1]